VQQLGTYCHISSRTDDPKPLTTTELFPPVFANEKDKTSYSLVSTKLDKTCSDAVIGTDLQKALRAGKCTQVARGSYVSGDNKIMGTIGVVNLATTNEAHYAGKVVGENDFIAPLTSAKGVASKLGNGTGVVESEYKGHYLILMWSEFVDGTAPTTTAKDNQLEQFDKDLVAGTANIGLTQRMVTGAPATPGTA
jgi:dUTPase